MAQTEPKPGAQRAKPLLIDLAAIAGALSAPQRRVLLRLSANESVQADSRVDETVFRCLEEKRVAPFVTAQLAQCTVEAKYDGRAWTYGKFVATELGARVAALLQAADAPVGKGA